MEIYNPSIYKAPIFYKNDDNGDNADIDFPQASNKKDIIDNSELQLNELKSWRNRNEKLVGYNKKLIQSMAEEASNKLVQSAEIINNNDRLLLSSNSLRAGQQIENQIMTSLSDSLNYEGENSEEIDKKIRTIRSVIDKYKEENIPGSKKSLFNNANFSKVKSSREIAKHLFQSITNINKHYLKIFQDGAKVYADVLRELNEILAPFKDAIKTDKDTVEFKFDETKEIIDNLIKLKSNKRNKRPLF